MCWLCNLFTAYHYWISWNKQL